MSINGKLEKNYMDNEEFEKLVQEGIELIPKEFLERIQNVAIVIEDNPSREQARKLKLRNNTVLFGLYEGIPKTKRANYGQVLPDKITIFKQQIESFARSENDIKRIVKDTVWHEIGHYFGMDEKQVRAAEKKRMLRREN